MNLVGILALTVRYSRTQIACTSRLRCEVPPHRNWLEQLGWRLCRQGPCTQPVQHVLFLGGNLAEY